MPTLNTFGHKIVLYNDRGSMRFAVNLKLHSPDRTKPVGVMAPQTNPRGP